MDGHRNLIVLHVGCFCTHARALAEERSAPFVLVF